MLQFFGYTMSLGEFLSTIAFFGGIIVGYINLHNKVSNIVARNDHADKAMKELRESLTKDLEMRHSALESRLFVTEQQSQKQEVFMTRIDERLTAVQSILEDIKRQGLK